MLETGKLPAKHDSKGRTIKFKSILNEPALPPLPEEWEFKNQFPQFDLEPRIWGNIYKGNCVVVASYAQQRAFEVIEQNKAIDVDEDQLIKFYDKLSPYNMGLYMLDYNKIWRNDGLPIGYGKKLLCMKRPLMHKIDAFARINQQSINELKYAMFLIGCNIGVLMPDSFIDQFQANQPWDDIDSPSNPQKGHAMMPGGWRKINGVEYVSLWTWGTWQLATWDWVLKHSDEAWAMIDKIDDWLPDSPINSDELRGRLDVIDRIS